MRAVILAGGELPVPPKPGEDDLFICADSGYLYARQFGLRPDVVLGDFDSSAPPEMEDVRILRYPADKDWTDTELAVRHALESGAREIVLYGALGGRPDHALANLALLLQIEQAGAQARIIHGVSTLWLTRTETEIAGDPGDLVSLLPALADADGVWTEHLQYPLRGETLRLGESRGVSNVMLARRARIGLSQGSLLVVHTAADGIKIV